jgi:hypothetical protein
MQAVETRFALDLGLSFLIRVSFLETTTTTTSKNGIMANAQDHSTKKEGEPGKVEASDGEYGFSGRNERYGSPVYTLEGKWQGKD